MSLPKIGTTEWEREIKIYRSCSPAVLKTRAEDLGINKSKFIESLLIDKLKNDNMLNDC